MARVSSKDNHRPERDTPFAVPRAARCPCGSDTGGQAARGTLSALPSGSYVRPPMPGKKTRNPKVLLTCTHTAYMNTIYA